MARRIDMKDVILRIMDGTNPANTIDVRFGEGNFQYTERRNFEYDLDRGLLDTVREGDEEPVDVSFEGVWDYVRGVAPTPSMSDALQKLGPAAAWVSSDTDDCQPYAVNLQLLNVPDCDVDAESLIFEHFRFEDLANDVNAGQISVSGRCNSLRPLAVRTRAPGAFVLTTPTHDDTSISVTPTLEWAVSALATRYHIVISTNADMSAPHTSLHNLPWDVDYTVPGATPLVASTKYYWRVTAVNDIAETACTTDFEFTTAP